MDNDNSALWASMLNNGNQWINNPWIYFVFLALFGRNGGLFGNGGAQGAAETAGLSQQITDNHNNDLVMAAIKGNTDAAATIGTNLNVGVDTINAAINALGSQMASCCCNNRMDTQKMGYENQIGNLQQTNTLVSRIDQLANGVQTGFAQLGFATQQQTCDLKTNENANTQRIIDTMNNHWNSDLQQRYSDARLEMSQLKQTAELISALKTSSTTTA